MIKDLLKSHKSDIISDGATGLNDRIIEKINLSIGCCSFKFVKKEYNICRLGKADLRTYWVRLECEENKNVPSGTYAKRSKTPSGTQTNIKQTNSDVNAKIVHLYNIKEMRANKSLFQDGEESNSIKENIENARGFTYETELADSVRNMIVLLKTKKDKSTYIHEFAHVYLNVLNRLAKSNSRAKELLLTVDKWLRHESGTEYTTAQHEKFANGFVAYVKQGKAPTYSLKRAFENFKK